jgi:IAA-amino acid hydrolase
MTSKISSKSDGGVADTLESNRSCCWLDEEMKSIQWPQRKNAQTIISNGDPAMTTWKRTVASFFQTSSSANNHKEEGDSKLQRIIESQSTSIEPFLISTRRLLHKYPELMYQERKTSQIIQRLLTDMGITNFSVGWAKNIHSKSNKTSTHHGRHHHDVITNDDVGEQYKGGEGSNFDNDDDGGGHGIVVDIGSGEEPCILLRADMDALPIVEQTPLPPDLSTAVSVVSGEEGGEGDAKKKLFHSNHHGKMHACGHDGHMTMLLGATYLIKLLQEEEYEEFPFPGTIRIIFQPAEEGGAGAKRMREEGVLTNFPPVQYCFGMHLWPTLKSGQIGLRSGAMLAAQDNFTLTLEGVGGHAAFPHLCRDPIVASASFVMNVQTLVSRGMNPLESGVVSVTHIDAGDGAYNVIPSKAIIRGTIRALRDDALSQLREGLVHIATKTAEAHGLVLKSYEFAKDNYPVTINDDKLFPFAAKCAGLVAKIGKYTPVDPAMGAEDFAFLAQGVPSAFFFLGQGGDGHNDNDNDGAKSNCGKCDRVSTNLGLHHPAFQLDEKVLKRGVALFLNLAFRSLKDLSTGEGKEATGESLQHQASILSK